MSTEAQIIANQSNSQKSTGPRTLPGKAVVSQNAAKHGLFALEAVISGESRADFDLYRDEMLIELAPVGPMEFMLAERVVSLSWRLKRVENMQNQAIDVMIERDGSNPLNRLVQSLLPKDQSQLPGDASASNGDLVLGRVAIKDYSNSRVLDRLLMYERRIENSMFKTINELRRLRLIRELEEANAVDEEFGGDSSLSGDHKVNYAKQSQFPKSQMNSNSCATKDYENKSNWTFGENKAKQSQTKPISCSGADQRTGKRRKIVSGSKIINRMKQRIDSDLSAAIKKSCSRTVVDTCCCNDQAWCIGMDGSIADCGILAPEYDKT